MQPSPSASMEERVAGRKSEMIAGTEQCFSNVEKGEFVANATIGLKDSALVYQSLLLNALSDDVIEAYKEERESFDEWNEYHKVISDVVIGDIWELLAGGSAGASFQTGYLYDVANTNATDLTILYEAIANKSLAGINKEKASIQQLDSTISDLKAAIRERYDLIQKVGQDSPFINTPSELDAFLDKDKELFKNWMAKRDAFELCLRDGTRECYASNTDYWIYLNCNKYQL